MHGATVDVQDPGALFEAFEFERDAFLGSDDRLYLRLPSLVIYVSRIYGARVTHRDMAARLSRVDFGRRQVGACRGERVFNRRLWVSPAGFDREGVSGVPAVPAIDKARKKHATPANAGTC